MAQMNMMHIAHIHNSICQQKMKSETKMKRERRIMFLIHDTTDQFFFFRANRSGTKSYWTWNIEHGICKRISPWISQCQYQHCSKLFEKRYAWKVFHWKHRLQNVRHSIISILPWKYKPSVWTGVHRSHICSNHWTKKALFAAQITFSTIFSEPPKWWMAEMNT